MYSYISWLFESFLGLLGLKSKSGHVLFLGLDNAGKSTLLYLIQTGKFTATKPTMHCDKNEVRVKTGPGMRDVLSLTTFDLGGHVQARRVWRDYFFNVDAVIFLIDTSDHVRFHESKRELKVRRRIRKYPRDPTNLTYFHRA